MANFSMSTQKRAWLLDADEAFYLRYLANLMTNANSKESKLTVVHSLPSIIPKLEPISANEREQLIEEELIMSKYCQQIQNYFGEESVSEKQSRLKRPIGAPLNWRVAATASTYFRRFYLNNSLSIFDPRLMM